MSLSKIISIPGMGGLYKMVAQMRNGGFIVESLSDSKRFPVSSTQRIVMLEDISIYTNEEDLPLKEVFLKMKEQDALCASISAKADPADLRAALKKVLPQFDEERVHTSDIRKMFTWYGLLKDIIGIEPEEEKKIEKPAETTEVTVDAPVEKVKKARTPKATAAKSEGESTEEKKPKAPKKSTKKTT